MSQPKSFEAYDWRILPGRTVCHAMVISKEDSRRKGTPCSRGVCGHTRAYPDKELLGPEATTRRCEQCMITILSGTSGAFDKLFFDHVTTGTRNRRRKAWREYLRTIRPTPLHQG